MPRRRPSKNLIPPWIESAAEPVILLSATGPVLTINPAGCEWLGLEPESWRDRTPHAANATSNDSIDRRLAGLALAPEFIESGAIRQRVWALDKSGQPDSRFASITCLHNPDGKPESILIVVDRQPAGEPDPGSSNSVAEQIAQVRIAVARHFVKSGSPEPLVAVLGTSPNAENVRARIAAAESGNNHVLICGPPGSENEAVARHLHRMRYRKSATPPPLTVLQSRVADQAFVQDIIRQSMAERKLFEPSAVCLLLVDAEELDAGAQTELAGFLRISPGQISLLATTHQPGRINGGDSGERTFDTFLASHLAAQTLVLPPLKQRRQDLIAMITALVDAECRQKNRPSIQPGAGCIELLAEYTWPGDIAELKEMVRQSVSGCTGSQLEIRDLPQSIRMAVTAQRTARLPVEKVELDLFLAGIEREVVGRALAQARYNRSQAARLLGISRSRLLRRCENLGITLPTETPDFEPVEFEEDVE